MDPSSAQVHGFGVDGLFPIFEPRFLVVADGLGDSHEFSAYLFALLSGKELLINGLELCDRLPHTQEERVAPIDRTSERRLQGQ